MQTKAIEQQAAAGVEALANQAQSIADRQHYEATEQKMLEYLKIAEEMQSELRNLRKSSEIRSLLGDLGLDGEYSQELNNLEDNINNLQQALDKVWIALYDMRKGV